MFKTIIVQFDFDISKDFTFETVENKETFISKLELTSEEYIEESLKIIPKVFLVQINNNTIVKLCDTSIQHNYRSILLAKLTNLSLQLGKDLRKQ